MLACPELGSQLIGARLPLICPQRRTGELDIQVLDIAFVDRPVRLAIIQRLDAACELRSQQLALCNETLAGVSFVLRAVHELGVSVALRLDGALGIPLASFGLAQATLELSQLARHTLPVRHESVVRPLQRLESPGTLFDERGRGCACRALLRLGGARGAQFLSESGRFASRFIQLAGSPLRSLSLASLVGPEIFGLLHNPALDRQHDIGVGYWGATVGGHGSPRCRSL